MLALPQELIDAIVHELCSDSPESVIYLSLTCVYFFRLLASEFQKVLASDVAPWAGHRLVLVSDDAAGLDVASICTSDELRKFEVDKWRHEGNPLFHLAAHSMAIRTMPINRLRRTAETDYDCQTGDLEDRVKEKLLFNGFSLFNRLATLARRPQPTTDHHGQHAAVLRNITAKQYVRDRAIGESDYAYSLGEVVAVFTTWSNDNSGLEGLDSQGLWAGHRFDIATMADVSGDGWTDASELAVEKLKRATGREKRNGKRVPYVTVSREAVTPDSSVHDNTPDDSYAGEDDSSRSRRHVWLHTSPPDRESVDQESVDPDSVDQDSVEAFSRLSIFAVP